MELAGSVISNGVAFRVVRYEAGTSGRLHRTNSMDFAVILSGSVELELDEGVRIALSAGDVLVQRGTIHNWVNNSSEPCTIAFVILHANEDRQ
jgi:quercetin dioxygenase-like cupin family protein